MDEVLRVMRINDDKPAPLERVNPKNVREVIHRGIVALQKERSGYAVSVDAPTLEGVWREFSRFDGESDIILCAINRVEDAKGFLKILEKKFPSRNTEAIHFITEMCQRIIEVQSLLLKLYEIDIIRKIGDEKSEEAYFGQQIPRLRVIGLTVKKAVKNFNQANAATIGALPEVERARLETAVYDLESGLQEKDPDKLKQIFDKKICEPLAVIAGFDVNTLNREKMREAIRRIDSK